MMHDILCVAHVPPEVSAPPVEHAGASEARVSVPLIFFFFFHFIIIFFCELLKGVMEFTTEMKVSEIKVDFFPFFIGLAE